MRKIYLIFFSISLIAIVFLLTNYVYKIKKINRNYDERYNTESLVALRKFPFPYRAALTICSDIDNTETLEEYIEIQKFLNTRNFTNMGKGLGLDIGNSFFFYEPPADAISYFQGGLDVADNFIRLIKAGYIDTMHSYGKKSDFTRKDAIVSLQELKHHNCKINVWVDHTKSSDNFGDDGTFGFGDHLGSKEYHADLTIAYGVKYAWLGKVTMITGQSVPINLKNFTEIYDSDHPIDSVINIGKEFAKHFVSILGSKKYAMRKDNDLVKITKLDDGQLIYEFIRFDNYWEGVGEGANSKGLAYAISNKTLNRLKEVRGYMIVYTHFGINSNCAKNICEETQDALRNLAKEFEKGNIYITTTSKLLRYYIIHKYLDWSYEDKGGRLRINIHKVKDPVFGSFVPSVQDLEGITFFVPHESKPIIYLGNKRIKHIRKNNADNTEKQSVTISKKEGTVR